MDKMKGSDYLVRLLEDAGVEVLFHQHGGAIAHVVDSVYRRRAAGGPIRPVPMVHEQAAAMAADGYARVAGKPAAVAVTSGPGATNLLTGIACAYYDSIPMIVITGQVRTSHALGRKQGRQRGFQETDVIKMLGPSCVFDVKVDTASKLRHQAKTAIELPTVGRPGPVLLDVPMDVQMMDVGDDAPTGGVLQMREPDDGWETKLASALMRAKRPVVVAGGGIRIAGAVDGFRSLVEWLGAPVVATFGGVDALNHDSAYFAGVIGTHGHSKANRLVQGADLIVAIGARLSMRSTLGLPAAARTISVNVEPPEQDGAEHLAVDVRDLVQWHKGKVCTFPDWTLWSLSNARIWSEHPYATRDRSEQDSPVDPYVIVDEVMRALPDDGILIGDAGQTVMWTLQSSNPRARQRVFSAHGHSPMGYAIPAAIGACIAQGTAIEDIPERPRPVAVLIGDGSFPLNAQELATIYKMNLPIKIFIMDNHGLGAIQDYQDDALEGRHYGAAPDAGYIRSNGIDMAWAAGIKRAYIESNRDVRAEVARIMSRGGPMVARVDLGNRVEVVLP